MKYLAGFALAFLLSALPAQAQNEPDIRVTELETHIITEDLAETKAKAEVVGLSFFEALTINNPREDPDDENSTTIGAIHIGPPSGPDADQVDIAVLNGPGVRIALVTQKGREHIQAGKGILAGNHPGSRVYGLDFSNAEVPAATEQLRSIFKDIQTLFSEAHKGQSLTGKLAEIAKILKFIREEQKGSFNNLARRAPWMEARLFFLYKIR